LQAGRLAPPPKPSPYGISLEATGFAVSKIGPPSTTLISVAWADIIRVIAFKRDWLTIDCICLAIVSEDGTTTEVNEDMTGWEAFTEELPKHLPGTVTKANWFGQVAFPAFATNETQIFARAGSSGATSHQKD
jgi:hypothetical protein